MTQRLEPKYIKRIRKLLSPDGIETGEWTDKNVKIKSTRGSVRSSGKLACVEVYFFAAIALQKLNQWARG